MLNSCSPIKGKSFKIRRYVEKSFRITFVLATYTSGV